MNNIQRTVVVARRLLLSSKLQQQHVSSQSVTTLAAVTNHHYRIISNDHLNNTNCCYRWKHSNRQHQALRKLDELAHEPEREAAKERRKKKKERKLAKKEGKKKNKSAEAATLNEDDDDINHDSAVIGSADSDSDSDWFGPEEHDDDDDHDEDGEESLELPSIDAVKQDMNALVTKFQDNLKSIRGAEPTPEMFEDVIVSNMYGGDASAPLQAVAQVVIQSPTLAHVSCFDPSTIPNVQKALQLALNLNPQVNSQDPSTLNVPLPRISKEVRDELAKQVNSRSEQCKQRIRRVRRKAMKLVTRVEKGGFAGKDDCFNRSKQVDDATEKTINQLQTIVDQKLETIFKV